MNLQRRRRLRTRVRRLGRQIQDSFGVAVLMLQELTHKLPTSWHHGAMHAGGNFDTGIWVPDALERHLVREELHDTSAAVQIQDTAYFSIHLPVARDGTSTAQAAHILQRVRETWRRWLYQKRPPRFCIIGLDANVRLPATVPDSTGNWVDPAATDRSAAQREQRRELLELMDALQLRAVNTYEPKPGYPSGRGTWRTKRGEHERQIDFLLISRSLDAHSWVSSCAGVKSDHSLVLAEVTRPPHEPLRLTRRSLPMTGWAPTTAAQVLNYQMAVGSKLVGNAGVGELVRAQGMREGADNSWGEAGFLGRAEAVVRENARDVAFDTAAMRRARQCHASGEEKLWKQRLHDAPSGSDERKMRDVNTRNFFGNVSKRTFCSS